MDNYNIRVSFIKYQKNHKNSAGKSAPYTIISHETGKVLSSHATKSEAEKHLQQMHIHKHMSAYLPFRGVACLEELLRKGDNNGKEKK
jgi:hypothetical protein